MKDDVGTVREGHVMTSDVVNQLDGVLQESGSSNTKSLCVTDLRKREFNNKQSLLSHFLSSFLLPAASSVMAAFVLPVEPLFMMSWTNLPIWSMSWKPESLATSTGWQGCGWFADCCWVSTWPGLQLALMSFSQKVRLQNDLIWILNWKKVMKHLTTTKTYLRRSLVEFVEQVDRWFRLLVDL